jgi:hypothetical protein
MKIDPYPKYIMELNTDEGFDKFFYSMCNEYVGSYELAYEATERHYQEYFGHRRYSNYESYRCVKNRRIKK